VRIDPDSITSSWASNDMSLLETSEDNQTAATED
jgi:hypothetical protein